MIKKISLIAGLFLFALILSTGSAFSQGKERSVWSGKSPEEAAKSMADRMKTNLSLTDGQHSQIYNIYLNHFNERKSFRERRDMGSLSREEMKQTRKNSREEIKSRVKSVLTDEQYSKLEELKKERMSKRKENREKRKLRQR